MRLLRIEDDGGFSLVKFFGNDIPRYAILSHTWGADHEEVTFRDLIEGTGKSKAGYRKLIFCRNQAARDNLQHFWVDTCCIDKSSSAELSEAINSMFAWYRGSSVCYAYLWVVVDEVYDGTEDTDKNIRQDLDSVLFQSPANAKECVYSLGGWTKSRWFSRGWTLQELIAPKVVQFYSREWGMIGTKTAQSESISRRTEIPERILHGDSLHSCSVAQRMSWASGRNTKREEDEAYCLLGIFGMNMPLIYGEGKRSFVRLQLAILDQEEDYSILAWSCIGDSGDSLTGLLASSPADFSKKSHLDTRRTPQIPKEWQDDSPASGFFRRWMPQHNWPAVPIVPYYSYLPDTNYDSLQSYVPSRAGSSPGEKLPDCLSIKTPRIPVRATSRGLHVSLPVKTSVNSETPSIAWIYCLYQGRLLCILLQRARGSTVFARQFPACLVTVDAKFLKEFEMNEVYCYVSGPVIPIRGIVGSLDTFHVALAKLGRSEEAAELCKVQNDSSDNEKNIDKIRALISELRHINPSNIIVQNRIDIGWLDQLKVFIETKTASSWNWAPLNPPRRPCTEKLWHLEWKCICGAKKWDQAPRTFAQSVLQLISQTSDEHLPLSSLEPPTPADIKPVLYVFLLMRSRDNLRVVSQIALDGTSSSDFINSLRKEYFKNRGIWQNIFSVWRFSHCNFVEFAIYKKNCVVLERNAVPNTDNNQYQYTPKPMNLCPPVSRSEFRMHFYQGSWFATRNRHTQDQLRGIQNKLVQHIPKRISPLGRSSDAEETLWGLETSDSISASFVFCYHLAIVIISFVYSRWMLGDLQNASFPVIISLMSMSLFWSFLGLTV